MIKSIKKISKKHYIQCGLAMLLTGLVLYFTSVLWSSKAVIVSFNAEAKKDITYQVFYQTTENKNYIEKHSVSQKVKAGKNDVRIVLPTDSVKGIRLDFGSYPETVKVKDIKLIGNTVIELKDFDKYQYYKIDSKKIGEDGSLTIVSNQNDPFMYTNRILDVRGKCIVDWCRFIIISVLAFLLMYKFVQYLSKFKIEKQHSRIDIVMLAVFFALLFVPMSHISDAEKSEQENRMLAKKPQLTINGGGYNNYGVQFDAWYNDHFFGRDWMMKLYQNIKYFISPMIGDNKVLVGKDGWLFFKDNNGMNNYANITELSENDMAKGLRYLQSINEWCNEHNKKFYYIIAPDKSKIYGEYYRLIKKQRSDDYSIGKQFADYIKKNSDIEVIYLYDVLMENKDKGLLYYKHDTHWTYLGGYYGYKAVMDILGMPAKLFKFKNISGLYDLENSLNGLVDKDYEQYKIGETEKYCSVKGRFQSVCFNPKESQRLFMLRDSFADGFIRYFGASFNKIQTYHYDNYQFSSENIEFIKNNADIVIIENVERLIPVYILSKSIPQNLIKEN